MVLCGRDEKHEESEDGGSSFGSGGHPNIGPAVAADLHQLGIHAPADLIGQDPYVLYQQLCTQTGVTHDPCGIM